MKEKNNAIEVEFLSLSEAEQKEKIAQNLELGKVKDYESAETSSNLPAVKKITILDRFISLIDFKKQIYR